MGPCLFMNGPFFPQQTLHNILRNGVDLGIHQELLVGGQLHNYDPEVGTPQVEGEELALLLAVGQASDVGWEALDTGGLVRLIAKSFLKFKIRNFRSLGTKATLFVGGHLWRRLPKYLLLEFASFQVILFPTPSPGMFTEYTW